MSPSQYSRARRTLAGMFLRYPWLMPLLILAVGGFVYFQLTARPPARPSPSRPASTSSQSKPASKPRTPSNANRNQSASGFLVLRGDFVVIGKAPDGDSVRFIPDNAALLKELKNSSRIRPSKDGSVQLRFEAIDAPELHFSNVAQPLGATSRDALLERMGFHKLSFKSDGATVASSQPERLRGAILSQAAEVNGRPISYALLERDLGAQPDGSRLKLDDALLQKTLNDAMLRSGMAYYTVYTSTPAAQRDYFKGVALEARRKGLGVWAADKTASFTLERQDSVTIGGQLVLPKLFRRCISYLQSLKKQSFSGSIADWLRSTEGSKSPENDAVRVGGVTQKLSDLLAVQGRRVTFRPDLLDIVFVEK